MLMVLLSTVFSGTLEASVVGGLAVLAVGTITTSFIGTLRKKRGARMRDERTLLERIDNITRLAESMHIVLVGPPKTDLNPNPAPGLVAIVPDLLSRTQKIEKTLFTNGGQNNTILDRMDRLEKALTVLSEDTQ